VVGKFGGGFQEIMAGGSFTTTAERQLFYAARPERGCKASIAGAVFHFVASTFFGTTRHSLQICGSPGFPTDPETGDCSKFDFLVLGGASGVPGATDTASPWADSKDPENPFFPCQGTFNRKVREWVTWI